MYVVGMIVSTLYGALSLHLANSLQSATISFRPGQNYTESRPQLSFTFLYGHSNVIENKAVEPSMPFNCTNDCVVSAPTVSYQKHKNEGMGWSWSGKQFTLTFQNNCFVQRVLNFSVQVTKRVNDILSDRSQTFSLIVNYAIRADTKRPNSSPVSNMPPLVTFNNKTTKLKIVVADLDNDTVMCHFCPLDGVCGEIANISRYFSIDKASCELIYIPKNRLHGYFLVALMLQDYPRKDTSLHGKLYTTQDAMSSVPLYFHIFVNGTNRAQSNLKAERSSMQEEYRLKVNQKLLIPDVSVKHRESGTFPKLLVLGPGGIKHKPLGNCKNQHTLCTALRWIPTADQIGVHVICYTFARSLATQRRYKQNCVKVFVSDPCFPNPCQYGGMCSISKGTNFFSCRCPVGFTGNQCEIETQDCVKNSCWNGKCIFNVSKRCVCQKGFHGYHCHDDINECLSSPCAKNADCFNLWGSFKCVCKPGYSGDPYEYCTGFCAGISRQANVGVINYPGTWVKLTSYSLEQCPNKNQSKSSVRCVERQNASTPIFFYDPKTINDVMCNVTIQRLDDILEANLGPTEEDVQNLVNNLAIITSNKIDPMDKDKSVMILDKISKLNMSSTVDVLANFANVASNLISNDGDTVMNEKSDENTTTQGNTTVPLKSYSIQDKNIWMERKTIINSVLVMGNTVEIPKNEEMIEIDTTRISVQVWKLNEHSANKDCQGSTDKPSVCSTAVKLSPLLYSQQTNGIRSTPVTLEIPSANYRTDKNCTELSKTTGLCNNARASLVVQKAEKAKKDLDKIRLVQMIAANLQPVDTSHLKKPISIEYHPQIYAGIGNMTSIQCVFWDETRDRWSKRGCNLDYFNSFKVVCKCDHMTIFALLMNVGDEEFDDDEEWNSLNILSDVACIFSSVCLVLTIVIHVSIKQIRQRRPTPIIVNLCACLLCAYVTFMLGIERTDDPIACHVITAMIHWFLLSSWCWMAVYSYSMYLAFVTLLNYIRKHFWCAVSTFAYGVPTLFVTISVAYFVFHVDRKDTTSKSISSYRLSTSCWLRGDALIYTFLLPVAVLLLYNLVVFYLVLRRITWKRKMLQSTIKTQNLWHEIKLGISMAACLGLTWIFGYLMVVSTDGVFHTAMAWLFSVFNASQGFTIFVVTCLRQQNVRKAWSDAFMRSKLAKRMSGRGVQDPRQVGSMVSYPGNTKMTRGTSNQHSDRGPKH